MPEKVEEARLENGTRIRHKTVGYTGLIDGTTEIRQCFTIAGKMVVGSSSRQTFQYRVAVAGESLRRVAPMEDLEVVDGVTEVVCHNCKISFQSKPGVSGKARGRCSCGEWICPTCLSCQSTGAEVKKAGTPSCLRERRRLVTKLAKGKKKKAG
jgi:hypothetical protein